MKKDTGTCSGWKRGLDKEGGFISIITVAGNIPLWNDGTPVQEHVGPS